MAIKAMPPKMSHSESVSSHSMAADPERMTADCTAMLRDHSVLSVRSNAKLDFFGMARVDMGSC